MAAISAMEPLLPEDSPELENLVTDLVARASALTARVHPILTSGIGNLVRSMNCYYSNLIEGHRTLPIDIDRALLGDFANEPERRNLQLEARAHIQVQQIIDAGGAPSPAVSTEFIIWAHREFCRRLPDELLLVENPQTNERLRVVPGELRRRNVRIGRHVPIDPEDIPAFLNRFAEAYNSRTMSKLRKVIGVAASHHRLLWIHPFLDGNGRVTRLMSHAWLRELDIGSQLWAISRGLARHVDQYKQMLAAADGPRRGDLDGRGNLTQQGLSQFCEFFLATCVDQVAFMESLLEPAELLRRMEIWCEEEMRARRLPRGSWPLLREAAAAGEFARGRAAQITGYRTRQARTVLSTLIGRGLLTSEGPRDAVRLGFPSEIIDRWFPRLYVAPAS
jgi:Fic family protein